MNYLVFQVGCIECGVTSYPIGLSETLAGAREIKENHPSIWDTEGGDGYVQIIDLVTCENVD